MGLEKPEDCIEGKANVENGSEKGKSSKEIKTEGRKELKELQQVHLLWEHLNFFIISLLGGGNKA